MPAKLREWRRRAIARAASVDDSVAKSCKMNRDLSWVDAAPCSIVLRMPCAWRSLSLASKPVSATSSVSYAACPKIVQLTACMREPAALNSAERAR